MQAMLAVGSSAPAFEGHDQTGKPISLTKLLETGPVILYFYPHDFTPGCTREACMFRDAFEELSGHGASIVGVSVDDDASHQKFASSYKLPYSLLSDPKNALAKRYGIARFLGLGAQRATFVIGRDGIIREAIHSELSMSRHVEDARAALARLAA